MATESLFDQPRQAKKQQQSRKVTADEILHALSKRHTDDVFLTQVKNGPTQYAQDRLHIMDGVAFKKSWANPRIVVYEVKVDRGDFLRDDKWQAYLTCCHEFYFACPAGMIELQEIPETVGLIYFKPETDTTKVIRKATWHQPEMVWNMLYYVVIARTDSDRHPFFKSSRELYQRVAEGKADGSEIGHAAARKIRDYRYDQRLEFDRTKRSLEIAEERLKDFQAEYDRVKATLKEHGINTNYYQWAGELARQLEVGLGPEIRKNIESIQRTATWLLDKLPKEEAPPHAT
jgi:hypothetical protein